MVSGRRTLSLLPATVVAIGLGMGNAQAEDPDLTLQRDRCATRLSIALTGESPSQALRESEDPQSEAVNLVATPSFRERFARFVNATHNRGPADDPGADGSYWMARYVLEHGLPWSDVFIGKYRVDQNDDTDEVKVVSDPKGLGYFRSYYWLERYAGNEKEGLKISTAYRIANNTVGLTLAAVTNDPTVDTSAKGRTKQPCAHCHHEGWFPLDKAAMVLTRKNLTTEDTTFDPPRGGPQTLLGGITVSNDGELVKALVDSEAFRFYQCRLAFKYLYARNENVCEGPIFDACMAAFTETGRIESAILAIATHPSFCQ